MNEPEFNLIDEKWIRVMDSNCNVSEVSLKEVILYSHNYKALSGELPTQDVAVMRLILAVLHTVYSRVDENGNDAPLDEDDEDEALVRWKSLWDKGQFPEKAISEYFDKWHERFWLFHGERPFFQIKESDMKIVGQKPLLLSKLNGEISKSGNKSNNYSLYSGEKMDRMSYSQAARWLLFLNSFDDASLKQQSGEERISATLGWLGQIGTLYIMGDSLFETLMLNLALINNDHVEYYQTPIWEKESINIGERIKIPFPSNLAELYTVQSRRIHLYRNDSVITHYHILAGDLFSSDSFEEPMTAWKIDNRSKNADYKPNKHDYPSQMWREFSALYNKKGNECAGIIRWYKKYLSKIIVGKNKFKTAIVSIEYDSKSSKILDYFSDSLTMHSELLSDLSADWRSTIGQEIEKCSELEKAIGYLAQSLYIASGGSTNKKDKHYNETPDNAKAQLYYRLDIPFREWLRSVDPECEDGKQRFEKQREWQDAAKMIAYKYAKELVSETDDSAIVGHMIDKKLYSSAKAMNNFKIQLNKIYPKE